MTENRILILAQRWRIGRVMYSTPFRSWSRRFGERWSFGENLSARSPRSGPRWQVFPETSMLAEPEWPRLKTVLSRKRVQFFIVELVLKWGFLSFSRGMIRLYRHVWTWYKSERDNYKPIVFDTFLALNRITMVSTMETIVLWVSFQKGLTISRFCIIFTHFELCFS